MKSTTRHLLMGSGLLLGSGLFGVVGYRMAGWDWLDACYMVVITIFSVGYGEVQATTPELKLFTMAVIFAGCSAYVYIVGAFINWLTEGQLQRLLGRRKMVNEIQALQGHTVICGFGRIGSMVAAHLQQAGQQLVIIETDPARAAAIRDQGFLCVEGDASEEAILLQAGLERAGMLASVLPQDAINVYIVLTARNLRSDITIIARGNQPSAAPKLHQAGADKVVLPAHIGAERIAHLILKPSSVALLEQDLADPFFINSLGELGLDLEEIAITEPSQLAGSTLEDLETREKAAFIVVAVRKADGRIVSKPPLNTSIEAGDRLVVMSHSGLVPDLIRRQGRTVQYRGASR